MSKENINYLNKLNENKIVKFYIRNKLWINGGILLLLFLANCFASWVSYPTFVLLGLFALFDNFENGISYFMFALPFCLIYPYVSLIIFLCDIAIYILKFYLHYFFVEKGKVSWKLLLFVGLFLVYALLPIGPYNTNLLFKIVIILTLFITLFAMSKKTEIFRVGFNIRILACSLLVSYILGTFLFVSPYLQSIIALPQGGLYRYQALLTNTNVLAMLSEIVLSVLAYKIIKNKGGIFDCILFGLTACAGIFTFSKLYFVTLGIILVAFFIGMLTVNWKKTLIVGSVCAVVITGVVLAIYFAKPSILQSIASRFGDFNGTLDQIMNKFTTTRWNLWKATFSYWGTNPFFFFFGRGLGAHPVPNMPYSAHNAYISMIDQLGVVGAILFIIPLVMLFRQIAKNTKFSKAIIIPIVVVAVIFMAEDLLFYINEF